MRVAIMGSGGVGGYLGGLLAKAGEEVAFIARGAHLSAMRERGLLVQSVHGDFAVQPAKATDDPTQIGPVDLVLLTTKTYQIDEAIRQMLPLIGPGTVILPLQNGVDAAERVQHALPAAHVLGGACWVVSAVAAPGVIRQESQFRRVVIGEYDHSVTPEVTRIVEALSRAGAVAERSDDIQRVLWTKFLFIASFSGLAAVARAPAGALMDCAETRDLLRAAMEEVADVATAAGVSLSQQVVDETMDFCARLAPDATASMQRDIMAGRPSELEAHNGYLVRRGAELGVPLTVHRFIYAALLPQERRARGGQQS